MTKRLHKLSGKSQNKIDLIKIGNITSIIYSNIACFKHHFNQGEFSGETLIQASLPMHHTRPRLGVAVIGLVFPVAYEDSKSEVLLEVESQC